MPSPEIIVKLAHALHVSSDYLMGIESNESIDVSGLNADDVQLVSHLIDNLRKRNQEHN